MNNDRELLELAARAAGLEGHEWREDHGCMERLEFGVWHLSWNPLEDDGDALGLVIKLKLHTEPMETATWVSTSEIDVIEAYNNDAYAATRRAITRAAAEIGRAMG